MIRLHLTADANKVGHKGTTPSPVYAPEPIAVVFVFNHVPYAIGVWVMARRTRQLARRSGYSIKIKLTGQELFQGQLDPKSA